MSETATTETCAGAVPAVVTVFTDSSRARSRCGGAALPLAAEYVGPCYIGGTEIGCGTVQTCRAWIEQQPGIVPHGVRGRLRIKGPLVGVIVQPGYVARCVDSGTPYVPAVWEVSRAADDSI